MGIHRRSMLKQMRSQQRGLLKYSRQEGAPVAWYEYDFARSTVDDTYDEGPIPDPFDTTLYEPTPGLLFKPPKMVRCTWYRFGAPENVQSDSGQYTVDTAAIRFSRDSLIYGGFYHPLNPDDHFNDRFLFQGKLYRVSTYRPQGQLYVGGYLMVDVWGTQIKPAETYTDSTTYETEGTQVEWTPGQMLNWPYANLADTSVPPTPGPPDTEPGADG